MIVRMELVNSSIRFSCSFKDCTDSSGYLSDRTRVDRSEV